MTTPTETPARPEWLIDEVWPFPVHELAVGDARVRFTDTGGDGPVLLFAHVGMWSILWRDTFLALADTYRCITLDPPASGLTIGESAATIAGAADCIDAIVGHLPIDELVLVFHDLGGPASLHAASRWPDRVLGLVAVNTFGWRPSGFGFRSMLALMGNPAMREIDAWTGWMPLLASTRFGVGRHWSRQTKRIFRRGMQRRERRSLHRYMTSARNHDYDCVDAVGAELADRSLLTIFGQRNDPMRFQPNWAGRFANCTQIVVPKGYHFPMCDDPNLVATSIDTWYQRTIARA